MPIAIVNLIFARSSWLGRATLRRALPFLRTGWQVIDAQVQHPTTAATGATAGHRGRQQLFWGGSHGRGRTGALALGIFLAAQDSSGCCAEAQALPAVRIVRVDQDDVQAASREPHAAGQTSSF